MSFAVIRRQLLTVGLDLAVEKDSESTRRVKGHEWSVTTNDAKRQQIACGWSGGTKTEAAQEALLDPKVQLEFLRQRLDTSVKTIGCNWSLTWDTSSGIVGGVIRATLWREGVALASRIGADHQQAGERLIESIAELRGAA